MSVAVALLLSAVVAGPRLAEEAPTDRGPRIEVHAAEPSSLRNAAAGVVASLDVRQQAASVVMGHIPTTDPAALSAFLSTGFAGFILMGSNIPRSEEALRGITSSLVVDPALPPLIAVDEEGGDVTRLPWDGFPAAGRLRGAPAAEAHAAFTGRGALVARGGADVNFGIVADVGQPGSFIFSRSLGSSAAAAADRVAAAVRGESLFVFSTLKHFPGHGAAEGDSHTTIPRTPLSLEQWRASVAPPFVAGIAAGAPLVMIGHLSYTAVDPQPASLSPRWHEILRGELGFDGVVVTDDLGMLVSSGDPAFVDPVVDAVASIAAGSDLVLMVMGSDPGTAVRMVEGIVEAVAEGSLPAGRLAEAATRVTELRLRSAAAPPSWRPCPECALISEG